MPETKRKSPEKRRAVVVERDPDQCGLLLLCLSQRGYAVTIAHDLRDALGVVLRTPAQLAFLQREGDGGRLAALAKSLSPVALVVETTDDADLSSAVRRPAGVWRVLPRPLTYEQLDRLLDEADAVQAGSSKSPGLSPNAAAAEPALTAISSSPHEFS